MRVEEIVGSVNRFPGGWSGYFRIGGSARHFDKIRHYAVERLAIFVGNLHRRSRRWGLCYVRLSPNHLGLINLNGLVVALPCPPDSRLHLGIQGTHGV